MDALSKLVAQLRFLALVNVEVLVVVNVEVLAVVMWLL